MCHTVRMVCMFVLECARTFLCVEWVVAHSGTRMCVCVCVRRMRAHGRLDGNTWRGL
jgi:hypothetical protein